MTDFVHQRHQPFASIDKPRELIVACPSLRSRVNFSRIVRAAGCCGVRRIVAGGAQVRLDPKIARDAARHVEVESRRSLAPRLKELKAGGFQIVGLEQTTNSTRLWDFRFQRQTVLLIGHEREGLQDELLQQLDAVVEIPVYGPPHSYNVATATAMALYEFCRQFPDG